MLPIEEVERLSRYVSGELPADEAARLEPELGRRPELRAALETLRALDDPSFLSVNLPTGLERSHEDRLVAAALTQSEEAPPPAAHPEPGRTRRFVIASAVGGAVLGAIFTALLLMTAGDSVIGDPARVQIVAVASPLEVDGQPVDPGHAVRAQTARLKTGSDGAAVLTAPRGTVLLPRNSGLSIVDDGSFSLDSGTVIASGSKLNVQAGLTSLQVTGQAFISVEPEDSLVRVTSALTEKEGALMKNGVWVKLGPPVLAAAIASGVTVFVLEGGVTAEPANGPPVQLAKGQQWSSPSGAGVGAAQATSEVARSTTRSGSDAGDRAVKAGVEPAELTTLDRPALVALVQELRAAKETALREKHALQRELEAAKQPRKSNFYRFTQAELTTLAENGAVKLRLPHFDGGSLKYGDAARDDARLTSEEEARIREIYARSSQRIRDGLIALYVEIGGDASQARELGNDALLNELRGKAIGSDHEDAVRRIALERAGLMPVGGPGEGSAILRGLRLLWQEDDRVIAELEALLGPQRAELLLNHPETSHSETGLSVGPARTR